MVHCYLFAVLIALRNVDDSISMSGLDVESLHVLGFVSYVQFCNDVVVLLAPLSSVSPCALAKRHREIMLT